jgi:hypothetical protein
MHSAIQVQRRAAAMNRILERSGALIEQYELDPALADALQPRAVKDPQVAEMMRLEGLANLLDQVAEKAGLPAPEPVDTSVKEFRAPVVTAVTQLDTDQPRPDDLPEPVLDEDKPVKKSTRRTTGKRAKK